ncbi:MAG: response regulator transcription factor [Chitinophagaceae bacterium]|nr:response regulator transcription factor [Chitinophagaceae bacterium]
MKLTCIIVDDEPLSRSFLEKFCERSERAKIAGSFASAADAISFLDKNVVEAIFLDVEMPGINGFQMLDKLSYRPRVIMTTSKTDYAFTAFEYNVTDFLKKPIEFNRFLDALTKIEEASRNTAIGQEVNDIMIKTNGSYIRLRLDDILYVEGMGDYIKYVTAEKTHITHSTLRAAEEAIHDGNFLKVHRSYIVNIKKISNFTDNCLSVNGNMIPVSKSNKAELLEKLKTA